MKKTYLTLHISSSIPRPPYLTLHTSPSIPHPPYRTLHTTPYIPLPKHVSSRTFMSVISYSPYVMISSKHSKQTSETSNSLHMTFIQFLFISGVYDRLQYGTDERLCNAIFTCMCCWFGSGSLGKFRAAFNSSHHDECNKDVIGDYGMMMSS